MKNSKLIDKLYNIIIILLAIIVVVVFIYQNKENKINKELKDKYREQYTYLSNSDLHNCNGLYNYSNKKIEYDDINIESKLCSTYYKLDSNNNSNEIWKKDKKKNTCTKNNMKFRIDDNSDSCSVTISDKEEFSKIYKKIFNKDIEEKEFKIDDLHVCYFNKNNVYCGLSETYTIILENDYDVYRVINKIEEKSSSVEIYDYFIKKDVDMCYKYYTTSDNNEKCTNKILTKKDINYNMLKKYGTLYKHIYNKNEDGTYYWVSSEPILK